MEATEFTADAIFDRVQGRVWELVPASMLLEGLGRHPLQLPLDADSKMKLDYLRLDFHLDVAPTKTLLSRLPIDATGLVEICEKHRDQISPGDIWTNDFFYLELLSQEGTLKPVCWGQVEDLLYPLSLLDRAREMRQKGDVGSARRKASTRAWAKHGEQFVNGETLTAHVDRPWLTELAQRHVPDPRWQAASGDQWDDDRGDSGMFAAGLYWRREPFYAYRQAMDVLWDSMVKEMWVSSIFSPSPVCVHSADSWREHSQRFGLIYRRHTAQQVRKARFEEFVLSRYQQEPVAAIAREAYGCGLWPFGTPKEQQPGYDPREACRQAVYRVIRKLQAPSSGSSRTVTEPRHN